MECFWLDQVYPPQTFVYMRLQNDIPSVITSFMRICVSIGKTASLRLHFAWNLKEILHTFASCSSWAAYRLHAAKSSKVYGWSNLKYPKKFRSTRFQELVFSVVFYQKCVLDGSFCLSRQNQAWLTRVPLKKLSFCLHFFACHYSLFVYLQFDREYAAPFTNSVTKNEHKLFTTTGKNTVARQGKAPKAFYVDASSKR